MQKLKLKLKIFTIKNKFISDIKNYKNEYLHIYLDIKRKLKLKSKRSKFEIKFLKITKIKGKN